MRERERERERKRKKEMETRKETEKPREERKGETARFFLPRRKNCVAYCRPVPIVEQSR